MQKSDKVFNMKLTTIKNREGRVIGEVDEDKSLSEIKSYCGGFFNKPFGKRETYAVYRGQLICRHTVNIQCGGAVKPERHTVIYLYLVSGEMNNDTLWVHSGRETNKQAQKIIDKILDKGSLI